MTDPTVVDIIENHFIPLLVINNTGGKDKEILQKYKEPAWNYQVIRFVDSQGKDIIPRKDKVRKTLPLLQRMKLALEKAKRPVPASLELSIQEKNTSHHAKAAISQYCFWTGETKLGRIDGVISTEAGWFDGKEVTLLTYDKTVLSPKKLLTEANKLNCANSAYFADEVHRKEAAKTKIMPVGKLTSSYRPAKHSDQKKQIQGRKGLQILTPAQQTKLNSWYLIDPKKALSFIPTHFHEEIK